MTNDLFARRTVVDSMDKIRCIVYLLGVPFTDLPKALKRDSIYNMDMLF